MKPPTNSEYANNGFGIDASQAAASGLEETMLNGGLRSKLITIIAFTSIRIGRFMAKHFLSISVVRFEIAQSPVVTTRPK